MEMKSKTNTIRARGLGNRNQHAPIRVALAALALSFVAGCVSYNGIATDGERVYLLSRSGFLFFYSEDILECRSGSHPLQCREVTPEKPTWEGIVSKNTPGPSTQITRVPDGLATLLQGMRVAVTTHDGSVLRGTVADASSSESLTIIDENKQNLILKWSSIRRLAVDADKANPYD